MSPAEGRKIERRSSRQVQIGAVAVGGGAQVSVQSMTKTDTRDVAATAVQIEALTRAGAEIIRLAVPDAEAARALFAIRDATDAPLVADIHFDHQLALTALEAGIDALRINPGNIGSADKVRRLAEAAGAKNAPLRIGVNAGSLEKDLLAKYGRPTPEAMVRSALGQLRLLDEVGFDQVKVSLKASDVPLTIAAYRLMAQESDVPLHLGVTEAGPPLTSAVKSALGIGALLLEGIGDTIRVSVTGDPVVEVALGYAILRAAGVRRRGVDLVSCPTCGRCRQDLAPLAARVESLVADMTAPLTVAVMGCEVNGPGEARAADVGLAAAKAGGVLFRQGRIIKRDVPAERLLDELM
ncbi:MAG: flavodoxin-dependent (E)-4-hydroxy-3-methylbut-2-enyl-diphosphate synthase, partial [Proteobacteria bacterium]|nr:flavodoxin-dependent (E)-4-hydroxy-3-methylbut-2-enyl-diphosphate synthase [Pseudomonadota bacterium]